jgi:hypothetical protein
MLGRENAIEFYRPSAAGWYIEGDGAIDGGRYVVHPSATESLSRKFVYGLVGGLAGTVVSPLAFDLSGVNIGLYRTIVLGMVFVGMACGWSAAVVISGRLIPKRSD